MEELYERQKDLKLTPILSAVIVGLGGVGFWVAQFLAMSGCPEFYLYDFDRLEETNFNRIALAPGANRGRSKTEAVEQMILALRPECSIWTFGKATEFTLSQAEGEFFFDCTDRLSTQQQMFAWATANKKKYIRAGYDGTHMTVTDRVAAWHQGPERTGYEITPSWVCPAAHAAVMAVEKAMYHPSLDFSGDIKDIEGQILRLNSLAKATGVEL